MTGHATTGRRWQRPRSLRLRLDIVDRALRADIADACDEAGIAVAAGEPADDADAVIIDRPAAVALPAIAIAPAGTHRAWPANVWAVVPPDTDAETLAAIVTVVAAGYRLSAGRRDTADSDDAGGRDARGDAGSDAGGGEGSWIAAGDAAGEPESPLSPREREVVALLAGGASNKEIALALALSVSTVKFHVAAIIDKLGARSRVDAVAIAVRDGLVMV